MSKRPCIETLGDEPEMGIGGHSMMMGSDMSRRPPWLDRCTAAQQRQQHLYLVVDDWERGYSIYRVREDDFDVDAEYPLVRVQAQHPYSWSFAAHGTKILAMQPSEYSPGIPVFDIETLGVTVCPYPPNRGPLGFRKPVYASVGERLLALVYPFLGVLGPESPPTEADKSWSWTCVEPPAPFASSLVSSYAVHPDGRTIFMSVKGWQPILTRTHSFQGDRNSTFAFDMERLEWTYLGEWLLPFRGQAHYDRELDAWVGLCLYQEGAGHVCCCDVLPAAAGAGSETMPAWKLGKDAFFDVESERHVGATLVYMGDSRFCLVESRTHKDYNRDRRLIVVKMTSVILKYSKDGDGPPSGLCVPIVPDPT